MIKYLVIVTTYIVVCGLAVGVSVQDQPTQIVSASDSESQIQMTYDPDSQNLILFTRVRLGSYIALGFGHTMQQTEIIQWAVDSDQTSYFSTFFAEGHHLPLSQPQMLDCYYVSSSVDPSETDFVDFVTLRPLDCDIDDSYVVQLNQQTDLISAWNPD